MWIQLVLLFMYPAIISAGNMDENDVENNLLKHLFDKFDNRIRPVQKKTDPVKVIIGIAYVQLVDLNEKDQMMISNVWVRQTWNNTYLTWNPSEFGNITTINVDPTKLWLPDIMLYNSAKAGTTAGMMYKFKTKVILTHTGLAKWYAPAIIRSGCNIDIKYFPFDDQLCELTFGSWAFSGAELDLVPDQATADLSQYLKSAELDLVSANAYRKEIKYSCCPEKYPNVIFILHLRREPGFHLYNVIIPSLILTCFAIITFMSPYATGERVGLATDSFLSLSFLCLMVAESIPVISDVTPLVTKFLLLCMFMIAFAVLFNLMSLNMLVATPIPPWVKFTVFNLLGPLVGVCVSKKYSKGNEARSILMPSQHPPVKYDKNEPNVEGETTDASLLNSTQMMRRLPRKKTSGNTPTQHELQAMGRYKKNQPGTCDTSIDTINFQMNIIIRKSDNEAKMRDNKEFWKFMALVCDRLFLLGFVLSFVFVSAFMLLKGFGQNLLG